MTPPGSGSGGVLVGYAWGSADWGLYPVASNPHTSASWGLQTLVPTPLVPGLGWHDSCGVLVKCPNPKTFWPPVDPAKGSGCHRASTTAMDRAKLSQGYPV